MTSIYPKNAIKQNMEKEILKDIHRILYLLRLDINATYNRLKNNDCPNNESMKKCLEKLEEKISKL